MRYQHTKNRAPVRKLLTATLILTLICTGLWAQNISVNGPYYIEHAVSKQTVSELSNPVSVKRTPELISKMSSARNACATINTTYTGFTADAVLAFEFAVDIWEASIETTIPVTVSAEFTSLNEDIVAFTEPNGYFTITGTGVPNTLYPRALAEQLINSEIGSANSIDILVTIDTGHDFYYGLDANPPAGEIDFVTLILHQLSHGLGFMGFGISDGTEGQIRDSTDGLPSIYDRFVVNGSGTEILSFPDPSTDLHQQLTGDDLFSSGSAAIAANNGNEPKIYSQSPFDFFKNYDHWDSSVFPAGTLNSLMTETLAPGQANHNPGPVTLGLFEDMGWSLCQTLSTTDLQLTTFKIVENPVDDLLIIEVGSSLIGSKLEVTTYNLNGQIVSQRSRLIDSNLVRFDGFNNLSEGLYIANITALENGARKRIKFVKK